MYQYVKRQGWVPESEVESFEVTFSNGKRGRILNRPPVIGESFCWMGKDSIAARNSEELGPGFLGRCLWWEHGTLYSHFSETCSLRENYYECAIEWLDGTP